MKSKFVLLLRIVAAIILIQTLYFKFSGAEESKYIFSTLGVEPFGRWFAGVSELIAATLILVPATQVFGALMGLGIMMGAILSHIFILGIVVKDDGGVLFSLAWIVLICCGLITFLQRNQLAELALKVKSQLRLK